MLYNSLYCINAVWAVYPSRMKHTIKTKWNENAINDLDIFYLEAYEFIFICLNRHIWSSYDLTQIISSWILLYMFISWDSYHQNNQNNLKYGVFIHSCCISQWPSPPVAMEYQHIYQCTTSIITSLLSLYFTKLWTALCLWFGFNCIYSNLEVEIYWIYFVFKLWKWSSKIYSPYQH